MSDSQHTPEMMELIGRLQKLAIEGGASALVIGVARRYHAKDGSEHDAWQVRAYGSCLSTLALTGELRDYLEEVYGSALGQFSRPTSKTSWWKRWLYSKSRPYEPAGNRT